MENSGEEIIEQLRQRAEEDAQRKSQQIRASMFTNPSQRQNFQPPINIFAQNKKPEPRNLFGNTGKSVNLFQMHNQGVANSTLGGEQGAKNIFNTSQKPAVVDKNDEQSMSEASSSAIKSQGAFKTEPELKEMKYQYKSQLQKIGEFSLRKFKNGVSPPKDQVYITVEKSEGKSGVLYLFVRNNVTKVSVYQGLMMKNISNPQHFMGKSDNIRFSVLKQNHLQESEEGNRASSLVKEVVKLQFISDEECEGFMKVVQEFMG